MPKYTHKLATERGERFVNSWTENSPDKKWADLTLQEIKDKRLAIAAKADEIAASKAHTKSLQIELANMDQELMTDLDYVANDVRGDRNFGPDSALYGGFGYIRESEKKRGGRRTPAGNVTS